MRVDRSTIARKRDVELRSIGLVVNELTGTNDNLMQ